MSRLRRYDAAPLGQIERTPQGGLRVPATLTRVGVFPYTQPDGRVRREYRPPDEVFAAESLVTLRGAPVTNLHPGDGRVDAEDWRRKAVGHAGEDVRQEGQHVAATLYVQDADVIRLIEAGTRSEVSCGYDLRLDETPGVTPEGEPYDAVQREIRYNHVALVPRGRAGRTVGLRLDADDHQIPEEPSVKIKIGGKEYEAGTPEAEDALAALQRRLDAAESEARKLRVSDLRAKAKSVGVQVRQDADSEGDVMTETLAKLIPGFSVADKSPEYIAGAFAAAVALKLEIDASEDEPEESDAPADPPPPSGPSAAAVRQDAAEARRRRAQAAREDADDSGPWESPAERARREMIERGRPKA